VFVVTENVTDRKDYDVQLIGQRVALRNFDWQHQLVGVLVKVERYAYVIKQDNGAQLSVLKHSVGAIGLAPPKAEIKTN
jgi:hypothetical protein